MTVKLIAILVFSACSVSQEAAVPLIDLTNIVVRQRLREPTMSSASGDSVGYAGGGLPQAPFGLEIVSLKKSDSDEVLDIGGRIRDPQRKQERLGHTC
jgi:hypothetical protein